MVNEALTDKRYVKVAAVKTKKYWANSIKYIADKLYPEARKIRLIMYNYGTHKPSVLYETFAPEEAKRIWHRFEFIYTSKHGSWLNMAEIELDVLMGQCLNRRITTIKEMKSEVAVWQRERNNKEAKINWPFTNNKARIKLKKLYQFRLT